MPNYDEAYIYSITGSGLTYYGSTTRALHYRKAEHKYKKGRYYSHQIIELGNWTMQIVELFPCKTKAELLWRERWWIENNECVNKYMSISTKEEKKARQEVLRKINSDKINEYKRQRYRLRKIKENNI